MEEMYEDIILTDDDLRELRDVRAAMLKEKHGQVDVDAAWEAFMKDNKALVKELQPKVGQPAEEESELAPSRTTRFRDIALGTLIGIAASLLCFLFLRPMLMPEKQADDNVLLVSEFIDQHENEIAMTTAEITSDMNDDIPAGQTVPAKSGKQEYISQDQVLDFTKIADNVTSLEERIITTPRGKVQKIILADGTKVLLNNESRLRFPTRFTGDTRTVWVDGEAYFAVAKDTDYPFIVKSRDISTTALGTKFNVKAYKDKTIHITLVDGSVKVDDGQQEVILKPGEDVTLVNDKLVISDADTKTYKQWEEGYFYYDNVPLVDVLVELGRWYNVNIELQNRRLMSYRLHFIADRNASIDDAIERLNEFRYLHAERVGDKIIVSEKNIQQQAP